MTGPDVSNARPSGRPGSVPQLPPQRGVSGPLARIDTATRPSITIPPALGAESGPEQMEHSLSQVLRHFAEMMGTDVQIQQILDQTVNAVVKLLPVDAASVTVTTRAGHPPYVAVTTEATLNYLQRHAELDEGPNLSASGGGTIAGADLSAAGRFLGSTAQAAAAGVRAVFTVPLQHRQQIVGALKLYRDTAGDLPAAAMNAAQTLADVTAAYVLNTQTRLDLRHQRDHSQHQALHDALTGLPNRTLILNRLHQATARTSSTRSRCAAVLFLDLDRLKWVNDTYGHTFGDELLVAVAHRLQRSLRPGDTLGRLAGDEFVVLCENLQPGPPATAIAERLRAALARPFMLTDAEVNITASIGIAYTSTGAHSPQQLLEHADTAMYQAKHRGGNRHHIFTEHPTHHTERPAGRHREENISHTSRLSMPITDLVDGATSNQ